MSGEGRPTESPSGEKPKHGWIRSRKKFVAGVILFGVFLAIFMVSMSKFLNWA